jgi:hypothetical protein
MERLDLISLCAKLEHSLNRFDKRNGRPQTNKVEFISGLKPDNYWLPNIHIGTSKTISDKIRLAWTVEIKVNDVCIFRESHIPHETEDLKVVEGMLIERILMQIFEYGVMSAKDSIMSLKQQ